MSKDALNIGGVAVDWDIKSTPRYCYYLMLDAKRNYVYYKKLNRHSADDFAKYIANLCNLYSTVRPQWDEEDRKPFDALYFTSPDFKDVLELENKLVEWLFKEGYFKTTEEFKRYNDVAEMIDNER